MLTTCRFSEFTPAICSAVLIFCLGSLFEFCCKTCFEVLSIASPLTKIKGAFHYAKDSGNFGQNSNGKDRFGFF